jgi:hypothetical protein
MMSPVDTDAPAFFAAVIVGDLIIKDDNALDQLAGVRLPVERLERAREIIGQRTGRAVKARGNGFDDNANEGSNHEKSRRVRTRS